MSESPSVERRYQKLSFVAQEDKKNEKTNYRSVLFF